MMTTDLNLIALCKGPERYVFLYADDQAAECINTLGRFASDPELSFTWYDAAVLAQKVRKERAEHETKTRRIA